MSVQATKQHIIHELWRRRQLDFKLDPHQVSIFNKIKNSQAKKHVLHASRRWGKSYLLCTLACEYAMQNAHAEIRFVAVTARQVKQSIIPVFETLLKDCPPELQPKWFTQKGCYEFANGSKIVVSGADQKRARLMRGSNAHLIIVDEAGFIEDLAKTVRDVLIPMTMRTGGKLILSSNSPETPSHDFISVFKLEAIEDGTYYKQTVWDCRKLENGIPVPAFSGEQILEWAKASGGVDSSTFRREYLCDIVIDLDSAVLPEFASRTEKIIKENTRPPFYNPIVSIDLGFIDFCGVTFGYYDFLNAKLVIEDELILKKVNSEQLVKACLKKENELWGDKVPKRVADGQLYTLNDLNTVHRYAVAPVRKDSLEAQVNSLRLDIQSDKIIINPRCKLLLGQMETAIFNKAKSSFARDASSGHNDLLASLIYLVRHINRSSNPYPAYYNIDRFNSARRISPHQHSSSLMALKKLLAPKPQN